MFLFRISPRKTSFNFQPSKPTIISIRRSQPFSNHTSQTYDAAVVGAGPGGLTAVANLLDQGAVKVAWIDPSFKAGRVGDQYREVPSNTRVKLFLQFVNVSPTLASLVKNASSPNSYTIIEALDSNKGCRLSYAADLIVFLTQELVKQRSISVLPVTGLVKMIESMENSSWKLNVETETGKDLMIHLTANRVILATGAAPVIPSRPPIPTLDLDIALTPSRLRSSLAQLPSDSKIAVVGGSHSAILALKNITDLSPQSSIIHLHRSPLKFAEQKDGWILHDNTGLKGLAADWARDVYPFAPHIKRIQLPIDPNEAEQITQQYLMNCTRAIYAIGYKPNPHPQVMVDGLQRSLIWDPTSGSLGPKGLYGCGIAFPEKVTDPVGNVESAVGFWKFMRFVKRISQTWV
ncbi:pyridine nucleotide-disulfide oxidoreductase-domain-containing protein [Melampsora americana]|nr:pyridine nucleotide-disulfide oxidoreductase-domain-containing protein [Melampsora americana]